MTELELTPLGGRLLTCTRCGSLIELFEFPQPWVQPDAFICWHCLPRKRLRRPEPVL